MVSLRFCLRLSLCLALAGGLIGCATPARRARDNAGAFNRLSPSDQRLVLHGHVRQGFAPDAVEIAWGKPDGRYSAAVGTATKEKPAREVWIYQRELSTYGPIGSYDQWQPGSRRAPLGTGLLCSPGFGFGGAGSEGWLVYHPRVQYTDSYLRRVVFVNGKLESYQQVYGQWPPVP